jgi:hypothetical protein
MCTYIPFVGTTTNVIYRPLHTAKSIGRRPRRTCNAISRKTNETRRIAEQYINSWKKVEAIPTVVFTFIAATCFCANVIFVIKQYHQCFRDLQ